MSAHADSFSVSGPLSFTADEPKPSLGTRLLRTIDAAQQLRADREILRYSSIQHDAYRQEFGLELERRMLGQ